MSHSQNGNIGLSNNSENNLDPIIPAGLIIKKMSKSFYLKKPITSHDFSILNWCDNYKEKVTKEVINKNINKKTLKQKTRQIRKENH